MANDMTGSAPEEWREVPSFPDYEASSWGRARRKAYRTVMHHGGSRTYGGVATYGTVRKRDTRRVVNVTRATQVYVHRLVCEAFHGPKPLDKTCVMHADDDPQNNRPENLSWGTTRENANAPGCIERHKKRWSEGARYGVSTKLWPRDVVEIRNRLAEGDLPRRIAADFGIARSSVCEIKNRKRWAAL